MTFAGYVSTCNHLVALRGYEYILTSKDWVEIDTEEKECYTAGLIEYCSNASGLPKPDWYTKVSGKKLSETKFTDHVNLLAKYDSEAYVKALKTAIPEFLSHGVVIQEVGNAI